MLIQTQNLTKRYGDKTVVQQVNLSIPQGQLVALLGPNGAGKSTTIKMLTGLLSPSEGSIIFQGQQLSRSDYQRQLGVVFQDSILDQELTVGQNLLNRAKCYRNFEASQLDFLIQVFELESILKQSYGTLSGGQRRRVDIARALVHQPKFLILDEPSTGLDIQTRNVIWDALLRLRQEQGLTILLTTHYLEEVEAADYVYSIDHGHLIAADTVSQLKAQYAYDTLSLDLEDPQALAQELAPDYQVRLDGPLLKVDLKPEQSVWPLLDRYRPLIKHFEYHRGSVDDLFINLTGREIR